MKINEITICLNSANGSAFEDSPELEVARILKNLAAKLENGDWDCLDSLLKDANGNKCGYTECDLDPGYQGEYAGDGEELDGTYGSNQTPCTVYLLDDWYCVEGSQNVNQVSRSSEDLLCDGVDVEVLEDGDTFTADAPIDSLSDLEREVWEYENA